MAHENGVLTKRLAMLVGMDLLIDKLTPTPITAIERSNLLDVLDDRVGTSATNISSQVPHRDWLT